MLSRYIAGAAASKMWPWSQEALLEVLRRELGLSVGRWGEFYVTGESIVSLSAQLTPEVLNEVVDRIVQAVRPQRIVLFESTATGRIGPNSDLDLLVIMPDGVHRRRTAQAIYSNLKGLGLAKDIRRGNRGRRAQLRRQSLTGVTSSAPGKKRALS
jgi:predicted nucleotidyltransferase